MRINLDESRKISVFIDHLDQKDSLILVKQVGGLIDDPTRVNRVTKCKILDENELPISIGYAVCVQNDQFVRKVGARLSLQKALQKSQNKFSREDRKLIHATVFGGDKHAKKSVEPVSNAG